jgi:hypothetical protein
MLRNRRARLLILVAALAVMAVAFPASGYGRYEFGVGIPISTSFGFSSFSLGLAGYARILLGTLVWEVALQTPTSFGSLYIRNTVATTSAFFLALGHVTNLVPHFGSTSFTFGAGIAFGQAFVARIAANLAVSIGGGFYPFLEFRFQFGLDP